MSPAWLQTQRRARGSTGSAYGFLFSVPGQVEGFRQLQRRLVQRQFVEGCPQVQDVALGAAVRVEALEEVLAQVGRKGRLPVVGLPVERARPAALQATAAALVEQPQVAQDLFQGDLLPEEGKVHLGTSGTVGRRRLDRGRRRCYASSGRGDHFFGGHVPLVAPGCFFVARCRSVVGRGTGRLSSAALRVKGAVGFPDRLDQLEQLAPALAQGDVAAVAFGLEAPIASSNSRIVDEGGAGGVPEIRAHQVVAFARQVPGAGRQRVAERGDAGGVFLGKHAQVADC